MKNLCNLLFELSNEDRLMILFQLQKKPMKIAHIAKKLNFTVQETSRNASRLNEANLISRKEDGSFELSEYGENALKFLPGFEFLSKHIEYFKTHTLSRLPYEFFFRIGDLAKCKYIDDVMLTFYEAEKMMDNAEKFLYLISDQHLVSSIPHIKNALEKKVNVKIILTSDLTFPEGYFEQKVVKDYLVTEKQAKKEGTLEERWIKRVDTSMGVSDKLNARIFFPSIEGQFDYKGFNLVDRLSHKYCKDLFEYYWNKSSSKIPEQVLKSYY